MGKLTWGHLVMAAIVLAGLWIVRDVLRPAPPAHDIAGATRDVVGLARQALRSSEDAREDAGALRLVAVVLGVVAPLVVAYLIHRAHAQSGPDPEELLRTLEAEELVVWRESTRRLDAGGPGLLVEGTQDEIQTPADTHE